MHNEQDEKPSLRYYERLFVLFVLIIFAVISIHVGVEKWQTTPRRSPSIHVHVVGEINGGEKDLELPCGATYGDLLGRISWTERAFILKMPIDRRLRAGEYVVIPRWGCLSVYMKGVKNELLYLPNGSTFRDLYVLYPYRELRRKHRKLRDGEIITISKSF